MEKEFIRVDENSLSDSGSHSDSDSDSHSDSDSDSGSHSDRGMNGGWDKCLRLYKCFIAFLTSLSLYDLLRPRDSRECYYI